MRPPPCSGAGGDKRSSLLPNSKNSSKLRGAPSGDGSRPGAPLASFNHNSRFYTLPESPQFDERGLWFHRDIGFSSHGHLPQTIVALVLQSSGGLTAAELGQPLRMDPRSFLWQFHQHPSLQREKFQGHYVYFAADPVVATRQKAVRSATVVSVPLPSAEESIAVLVRAMQHPDHSPEQLAAHLQAIYPHLSAPMIVALFDHHHLTLKKTPTSAGSNA